MMMTISYPWDQTNHTKMAHIYLLVAQVQPMIITLIYLQLMAGNQTVLHGHITLKSTVCLFKLLSHHIITNEFSGIPCDANGSYIDPSMPPPPHHPTDDPDNWPPYNSQLEFETAQFSFMRKQMSAGNINILLDLWSASLFKHGDQPPFTFHWDLYDTINPSWMDTGYKVWYCNSCTLIHIILSNLDFDGEFDYVPLQEHDMHGNHQFENFMSGNWAWKQAVSQNQLLY